MRKKLFKFIKYVIFHKTDTYYVKIFDYSELGYKDYILKRKVKLFFININSTIEKSNSLKQNKVAIWIYNYGNNIINLKEIL